MAQCVYCKGIHPGDDRTVCPVVIKTQSLFRVKEMLKSETFYGSSPAPFIGRTGYPEVNVGILSPTEIREDAWLHDAPGHWAQQNFQIPRIAELRFSLVNSRSRSNIKNETKIVELSREVGIASKPVDVEIKLKKIPNFKLNIDAYSAPFGPGASIEKASITSNPKVDSKVEKVVSDKDLKAGSAVTYLYSKGYDENFLSKVLSVGAVGIGKNRKLVPTRWSITATDDTIAKYILAEIRDFSEIDYSAYFGSYLGNYYIILCFPGMWGYELFEMYLPSAGNNSVNYSTDYEDWKGRKNYAENCAGGISRTPRKILSRRGTRMYWVGAFAPNTRGGRRAHPPKAEKNFGKKINKKERRKAIRSGRSATSGKERVKNRGHRIPEKFPFILDNKFEGLSKTQEILNALKAIGLEKELERVEKKSIRAGRGKLRGRKYNVKKGPLIVVSKDGTIMKAANNIPGVDIVEVKDLNVEMLAPGESPGRLTLWTAGSIKLLEERKS